MLVFMISLVASVAQRIEHWTTDPKVRSSNLLWRVFYNHKISLNILISNKNCFFSKNSLQFLLKGV